MLVKNKFVRISNAYHGQVKDEWRLHNLNLVVVVVVDYLLEGAIGPSEVRALPVRRCRWAAWQTKWPLNSLFFSPLLFFFLSALLLFSQKELS